MKLSTSETKEKASLSLYIVNLNKLSFSGKVIYRGFLNSCLVLYASENSSGNHYVKTASENSN